jgi:hypothetical protein
MNLQLRLFAVVGRAAWGTLMFFLILFTVIVLQAEYPWGVDWSGPNHQQISRRGALVLMTCLSFCALGRWMGWMWFRMMRQGSSLLMPGFELVARRAGVLQTAALWALTTGVVVFFLLSDLHAHAYRSIHWSWLFAAAGLAASGVAAGLLLLVHTAQSGVRWRRHLVWIMGCIPWLVYGSTEALSGYRLTASLLIVFALGTGLLVWSLRQVAHRFFAWHPRDPISTVSETSAAPESLDAAAFAGQKWQHLFLMGAPGVNRKWAILARVAPLLVIAALSTFYFKAPGQGVIFMIIMWLGFNFQPHDPWVSQHLALLPRGLHRQSAFDDVLKQTFYSLRLQEALVIVVAPLGIWGLNPSWQDLIAFALLSLTVIGLTGVAELAVMPVLSSFPARWIVPFGITGAISFLVASADLGEWLLPATDPWAQLVRSMVWTLIAALVGIGFRRLGRWTWSRMDWSGQPLLPRSTRQERLYRV